MKAARVKLSRLFALTLLVLGALLAGVAVVLTQPLVRASAPRAPGRRAEPERLRDHVRLLAGPLLPRDQAHPEGLLRAAAYIEQQLLRSVSASAVSAQPFTASERSYRNVRCRLGPAAGPLLVIGAHYDAYGESPGADDNASGVAALLELARFLGVLTVAQPVELVFYALEEPPFFHTEHMGSAVHAEVLRRSSTQVRGMISLETMGFFSDAAGSQRFPTPLLRHLYSSTGDFIALIGRAADTGLLRQVKSAMKGASTLPVRSLTGPRDIPGVDFSDQLNYWDQGYPAIMVTDTAFYRNPRYHTPGDLPETLDYQRLAQAVQGLFEAVLALTGAS